MASYYFGGVEGGSSCSKCILTTSDGTILARSEGPGTNQHLVGLGGCLKTINDMVQQCLATANLSPETTLDGLGLSLSGVDDEATEKLVTETAMKDFPQMARHIFVCNDTESVIAAALENGGVVQIAGTGSICLVKNPDGSKTRCGGWGHMLGDEASAAWISLRACKIFFDHEDNFRRCPHSIDVVKEEVFKYFNIKDKAGLLEHLYAKLHKATFAGLCKELAQVALATKDPLCLEIFKDAGRELARHLLGVSAQMHQDLKDRAGGVPVVCVGSVFKSWELLQPGFEAGMKAFREESGIREVTLLRLKVDAAIGSVSLGAKAAGKEFPLDHASATTVLYHSKFA